MKKLVKDLKIGDTLATTGMEVIKKPTRGYMTPSGKYEVIVKYPNGGKILKLWNGTTPMEVIEKI